MNLKIEGVNVEKTKKFNMYTSYVKLKNSFCFGSSSYKKIGIKKYNLKFFNELV